MGKQMLSIVSSAEPKEAREEELDCIPPSSTFYLCVSYYTGPDTCMF